MHEGSIAQGVLQTALAAAGARQITRITVVTGVFSGMQRESLDLFFGQLSKGTAAQGATLEIRRPPAKVICDACGHREDYDLDVELAVRCSRCGAANRLEGGHELYVDSIEVEDETERRQGDPESQ